MAAKTRTLGPGSFTVKLDEEEEAKDFSADLTKAALTPSTDTGDPIVYLDGHEEADTTTSWTFDGTVGDDFSEDGLAAWCLDNNGKTGKATFIPNNAGGIEWTFDVTITPIGIGGDMKTKNTTDFSFPATNVDHAAHSAAA